jgi:RND family efflux transporter MFP subunit
VKVGQILFLLDREQANTSQPAPGGAMKRLAKRNTEIRSPLEGVVLAKFSNAGDMVTATPPSVMALVADIDLMKLTALIPEGRLAEVHVGQEATITTDALPGKGFGGRVALVAPVADVTPKSTQVEILVENRDHTLKPGMFARARVFTAYKPRTILVSPSALIDGHVTVAEGGVARVRTVQTGIRAEEAVEILSGVAPGDLVVVSGNNNLKDGARIDYKTP